MSSRLFHAVTERNKANVDESLSRIFSTESWSLVSFIDELLPLLFMESNLRFGNFHASKMSLFIRELSLKHYFSKETEKSLLKLITYHLLERNWVELTPGHHGFQSHEDFPEIPSFIASLKEGNTHNAFHYAMGIYENDPHELLRIFCNLGVEFIPENLGHSLSCFYPAFHDIIAAEHPATPSAILSFVMLIARYQADDAILAEDYRDNLNEDDPNKLLPAYASGDGIEQLHYMITLGIFVLWENSFLASGGTVPYNKLTQWAGEQTEDSRRSEIVQKNMGSGKTPLAWDDFKSEFTLENRNKASSIAFNLALTDIQTCYDFLFRFNAEKYEIGWDPHNITGIYCALKLYESPLITDKTAALMALDQAVNYNADRYGYE